MGARWSRKRLRRDLTGLPPSLAPERPPGVAVVAQGHAVVLEELQLRIFSNFFNVMDFRGSGWVILSTILAERMVGEEP